MHTVTREDQTIVPSKIVCAGRNYVAHIAELGNEVPAEPVIFLKPNSALSEQLRADGEDIHYEGEISFLLKNGELDAVGFGLDLTRRAVQTSLKKQGLPWERAKAFDGSAVFSHFVRFDGNPEELRLELWIDGQLAQQGGTPLMLFKPAQLLASIQSFMSLNDGDILMTGTPEGVGLVRQGASFCGRIYAGDSLLVEHSWIAI